MSDNLKGACIIGQSGGPSSVLNATAYGMITTALAAPDITNVYGAAHGIKGVIDGILYDMASESMEELRYLPYTPSSELGTCRYKLPDPDESSEVYDRILEVFQKNDVRYFFYNGGNDSMDTCEKISRYMDMVGWECRVIGVPKTIDNDLYGTDHCPGYGSAAKYIATATAEVWKDACVYDTGTVVVLEIMGRHAGWLTAASSLATLTGCGPDLLYVPEVDFNLDQFLNDIAKVRAARGSAVVAVSEGIHYADGTFVSEAVASATDGFGHAQFGGLSARLASLVKEQLGIKVRGIEFNLLQRCASHCASKTDVEEGIMVGKDAVLRALAGETGIMVGLEREPGPEYHCITVPVPLSTSANAEKLVPLDWINRSGNGMNEKFYYYALPLIAGELDRPTEDGLPRFARLVKDRI